MFIEVWNVITVQLGEKPMEPVLNTPNITDKILISFCNYLI